MKLRNNSVIPSLLLVINIIFTLFLIEELIDATDPNYGSLALWTPVIAVISLIYIKKFVVKKNTVFIRILQVLNWFFILFPILILLWGMFIMMNY